MHSTSERDNERNEEPGRDTLWILPNAAAFTNPRPVHLQSGRKLTVCCDLGIRTVSVKTAYHSVFLRWPITDRGSLHFSIMPFYCHNASTAMIGGRVDPVTGR